MAITLLAGCTAEADEPPPPTTTSAEPTVEPSTTESEPEPEPEPTPTGLVRPEAMDQNTDEGAIAAAEYYAQLAFGTLRSQDSTAWLAGSTENCGFCATVVEMVEETISDEVTVTGGEVTVRGPTKVVGRDETIGVVGIDVPITVTKMTNLGSDGQELESWPVSEVYFYTELAFGFEGWVMLTAGTHAQAHS